MPGGGGGLGVSANEYSYAHGAHIKFGDLTPFRTGPTRAAKAEQKSLVLARQAQQQTKEGPPSHLFSLSPHSPQFYSHPFLMPILPQYSTEPEFVNLLKVHKNENFFGFDFEICTISMLVMHK
jgi:hypothetical protein